MQRVGQRSTSLGYPMSQRRVLGMSGPIWTMAVWFGISAVVATVGALRPMHTETHVVALGLLAVYAGLVAVALLVMRDHTPRWFVDAQVIAAVALVGLYIYLSVTPEGAVTASVSFIAIAAYVGFWMTSVQATVYLVACAASCLVGFAAADYLPELFIPWIVVTALSCAFVASFRTVIRHLNEQVVTDPLTGLLNRSGLFERAATVGAGADAGQAVSLVVIDLDGFKDVNDRLGHLAGDDALRDFGAVLRSLTRPTDLVVRSGGDEFLLVLPRTSAEQAQALVARIREQVALALSAGVVEWATGEPFDLALGRADRLMYADKARRSHETY